MSDQVPAEAIERIVGTTRRQTDHIARAVSSEQTVYIMHSRECLSLFPDLRKCPWSLALDRGIDVREWTQDVPVIVRVRDGRLIPALCPVVPASRVLGGEERG